jgi:hypothetical protein
VLVGLNSIKSLNLTNGYPNNKNNNNKNNNNNNKVKSKPLELFQLADRKVNKLSKIRENARPDFKIPVMIRNPHKIGCQIQIFSRSLSIAEQELSTF